MKDKKELAIDALKTKAAQSGDDCTRAAEVLARRPEADARDSGVRALMRQAEIGNVRAAEVLLVLADEEGL